MRHYNQDLSAAGVRDRRRRGAPRQPSRGSSFTGQLVAGFFFVAFASWNLGPQVQSIWTKSTTSPEEVARVEASAYYSNCGEARAAGVAPLYAGQPGYREGMDGDGDGIACEPYR